MWYSKIQPITTKMVKNELNSLLCDLPLWRKEIAHAYIFDIDQFVSAKAYLLLKELLYVHYGIRENIEFEYGPYGKPRLHGFQNVHFNYSHCHKAVLCAVGDEPIGVDVEEIQYDEDIINALFNENERRITINAEFPSIKFTEYWTRKESYLKLIGTGLSNNFREYLYNIETIADFQTEVNQKLGYVATIATLKST